LEGTFCAEKYIELLENHFLPYLEEEFPDDEPIYFVQDCSRVHNNHAVEDYFAAENGRRQEDGIRRIQLIEWPSKGADLNPIENIWGMMLHDMEARRIRDPFSLFEHVEQIWEGYRFEQPNLCQNLSNSMDTRLQRVLENNGYWCGK